MNFFFDNPGQWLVKKVSEKKIKNRLAMLMIYIAHVFLLYLPFSGEGVGVYLLSYFALVYAAIIVLEEAEE